jgi:hypothetical protein
MRISRLTIDKLGIKLYDRVSSVLAELIANSYDADATTVEVSLPWGVTLAGTVRAAEEPAYQIVVADNGHGMTAAEINAHYLMVGSDRRLRTGTDLSRELNRPVMGRKGIGKLAAFGICRTIEVVSAGSHSGDRTPEGWPVSHIVMDLDDMLSDTERDYYPRPGPEDGTFAAERGTTIVLRDFFRKRVNSGPELNRQLASRFGLERRDWRVVVRNSVAADGELEQFILSDLPIDVMEETRIDVAKRPVRVGNRYFPVTGWVAYSKHPYRDDAMAGIRLYARGKIVAQTRDFGIPAGFTGEFKLRSYVVGAVHADWLDDEEDLVRSDRQDIMWNSDRGEALAAWGQALVKELGKLGERSVRRRVWEEFVEKSNIVAMLDLVAPRDRLFRESVIDAARILVNNKDRAALDDRTHVESIVRLAMSLGPQRSLLETLKQVADEDNQIDVVVALFERARVAEVYSLGQIASERVAVVARLQSLIDDRRSPERPFQELIERAPWLLAPEWTPLGMNESLRRVRAAFERWHTQRFGVALVTTAIGSERREPDFVLLHDAGELWVVEIKRMDYHLTDEEYNRAINYLYALEQFLDENPRIGEQFPRRRLTFIVDHIDRLRPASLSSLASDARVDRRTWRELLDSTLRAHRDFLDRVYAMKLGESDGAPDVVA